ncbi:hypothetical protein IF188_16295 [Microbacterium sp. NEAU-LLC]|uniref:Lipoprotein n=1 Tax=Microbacterium helvum TaxID=2773713 RepID=A0ABR8NRJ7_9MICO|nr:hypothetical protein [Microbacterium helvum]MBD3943254.1 hypothetical protein [Microbacterium helvum]
MAVLIGCAPQQFVTLDDVLGGAEYRGITNPRENTDEVCDGIDDCIEGWESDGATYLRFTSIDAASTFADSLDDDVFQSNFIVIEWDDSVGATQRKWVEDVFLGAHQSD